MEALRAKYEKMYLKRVDKKPKYRERKEIKKKTKAQEQYWYGLELEEGEDDDMFEDLFNI